ncbi:MAG: hypothetical protein AAFY41_01435 [Bacteroidota bacterium]
MRFFACNREVIYDSITQLIKGIPMNALKKTAIGLSIIAMTAFGDKAFSQSNDNLLAFNANAKKVEANTVASRLNAPVVKPGNHNDVYEASKGKRLAIHIRGGKQGERSALETAKILANAFADRRFTDKPMYITATYEESGKDQPTGVSIFMDGVRYSKNGVGGFLPRQVGGAIDIIAEDFVDEHGNHLVIPEGVEPTVVASLN